MYEMDEKARKSLELVKQDPNPARKKLLEGYLKNEKVSPSLKKEIKTFLQQAPAKLNKLSRDVQGLKYVFPNSNKIGHRELNTFMQHNNGKIYRMQIEKYLLSIGLLTITRDKQHGTLNYSKFINNHAAKKFEDWIESFHKQDRVTAVNLHNTKKALNNSKESIEKSKNTLTYKTQRSQENIKKMGVNFPDTVDLLSHILKVPNKFDDKFITALESFQKTNGIDADGIIGEQTFLSFGIDQILQLITNKKITAFVNNLNQFKANNNTLDANMLKEAQDELEKIDPIKDHLNFMVLSLAFRKLKQLDTQGKYKENTDAAKTTEQKKVEAVANSPEGQKLAGTMNTTGDDGKTPLEHMFEGNFMKAFKDPRTIGIALLFFLFGIGIPKNKATDSILKRLGWIIGGKILGADKLLGKIFAKGSGQSILDTGRDMLNTAPNLIPNTKTTVSKKTNIPAEVLNKKSGIYSGGYEDFIKNMKSEKNDGTDVFPNKSINTIYNNFLENKTFKEESLDSLRLDLKNIRSDDEKIRKSILNNPKYKAMGFSKDKPLTAKQLELYLVLLFKNTDSEDKVGEDLFIRNGTRKKQDINKPIITPKGSETLDTIKKLTPFIFGGMILNPWYGVSLFTSKDFDLLKNDSNFTSVLEAINSTIQDNLKKLSPDLSVKVKEAITSKDINKLKEIISKNKDNKKELTNIMGEIIKAKISTFTSLITLAGNIRKAFTYSSDEKINSYPNKIKELKSLRKEVENFGFATEKKTIFLNDIDKQILAFSSSLQIAKKTTNSDTINPSEEEKPNKTLNSLQSQETNKILYIKDLKKAIVSNNNSIHILEKKLADMVSLTFDKENALKEKLQKAKDSLVENEKKLVIAKSDLDDVKVKIIPFLKEKYDKTDTEKSKIADAFIIEVEWIIKKAAKLTANPSGLQKFLGKTSLDDIKKIIEFVDSAERLNTKIKENNGETISTELATKISSIQKSLNAIKALYVTAPIIDLTNIDLTNAEQNKLAVSIINGTYQGTDSLRKLLNIPSQDISSVQKAYQEAVMKDNIKVLKGPSSVKTLEEQKELVNSTTQFNIPENIITKEVEKIQVKIDKLKAENASKKISENPGVLKKINTFTSLLKDTNSDEEYLKNGLMAMISADITLTKLISVITTDTDLRGLKLSSGIAKKFQKLQEEINAIIK